MCISTLHVYGLCNCEIEHIEICRHHIDHTYHQIDDRPCWDYKESFEEHRFLHCGKPRSSSHRSDMPRRYITEWSFESLRPSKPKKVRKVKKDGNWEIQPDEETGPKSKEDKKKVDETMKMFEEMSAIKEDGKGDIPAKGPETKKVKKELQAAEEAAWQARERVFNEKQAERKEEEEFIKPVQVEGMSEEILGYQDERSWTPINDLPNVEEDLTNEEHKGKSGGKSERMVTLEDVSNDEHMIEGLNAVLELDSPVDVSNQFGGNGVSSDMNYGPGVISQEEWRGLVSTKADKEGMSEDGAELQEERQTKMGNDNDMTG